MAKTSVTNRADPATGAAARRTLKDFEAYTSAGRRLSELRIECGQVDRQIVDGISALSSKRGGTLDELAEKVIAGDQGADSSAVVITREELARLVERRRVLERAIELQVGNVESARFAASREICSDLRVEYSARVKQLAAALLAAVDAARAEQEVRDWCLAESIAFRSYMPASVFRPLLDAIGERQNDQFDPESMLVRWLKEVAEDGYCTVEELQQLGVPARTLDLIRTAVDEKQSPAEGFIGNVVAGARKLAGAGVRQLVVGLELI